MAIIRDSLLLAALVLLAGCGGNGTVKPAEPATNNPIVGGKAGEAEKAPESSATSTAAAPTPLSAEQRAMLDTLLEVMHAGEWQVAREMAQELILAHPMLAEGYANMGHIHLQLKDSAEAEQAWLKALQLRPGWPAVCNRLGIFYRQQGRFDESLAMYRQALSSDESYPSAHRNIAILYEIYRGEYDKALQHYKRYLALNGGEGDEVTMWIADLERRVKRGAR